MQHKSPKKDHADRHIVMMMVISDLSMGRSTREEKTERREVKVVSLEYSSSVQWNILLDMTTIMTLRDMIMMKTTIDNFDNDIYHNDRVVTW